jgi:periplasmic protein TonB
MARRFMVAIALMVCATFGALGAQQAPPSDQPPPPQRVRISSDVATQLVVKRVDPVYSRDLRKRRIQGLVVLNVRIGRDGNVLEVAPASGPAELLQAASDSVKQWKFKPYLLNGQPVIAETQIMINFTLSGN